MRLNVLALSVLMALSSGTALAEVQNIDSRIIEVPSCSGHGRNVGEANDDARTNAVDLAVLEHLVQTDAEKARYQQFRSNLMTMRGSLVLDFQMTDKVRENGQVRTRAKATIDRQALLKVLREQKVLDTLNDRPSTGTRVYVTLAPGESRDSLHELAVTRVHAMLAEHQFELVDEQVLRERATEESALSDLTAPMLAAQTCADLVFQVSASVTHTRDFGALAFYQASVQVSAYTSGTDAAVASQTYTSRELTFQTSEDQGKIQRAVIEEAIGGATEVIMQTALRAAKETSSMGRPFKVVCQDVRDIRQVTFLAQRLEAVEGIRLVVGSGEHKTSLEITGRSRGDFSDALDNLLAQDDLSRQWEIVEEQARTFVVRAK
jgi:hypothetical protein